MKNLSTYRTFSVTLAAIFFIFNIGLPLIVASCPMAKNPGQAMCSMCPNPTNSSSPRLTSLKNTSCCVTVIAANRNTNEFVRTSNPVSDVSKIELVVMYQNNVEPVNNSSTAFLVNDYSSSPPLTRDIPVLISSFLI